MKDTIAPREQLIRRGHALAEVLNDGLGEELCQVGPLHVSMLAARVGRHIRDIYLPG